MTEVRLVISAHLFGRLDAVGVCVQLLKSSQAATLSARAAHRPLNHVSPSDIEEFYALLDGCGRVTCFGATSGILSVKMPTPQHEAVVTTGMDIIKRQIPPASARCTVVNLGRHL